MSQGPGQLLTAKGVGSQRWFAALSAHRAPPWGWLSLSLSPAGAEGRLPLAGAPGDGWGPQSGPESITPGSLGTAALAKPAVPNSAVPSGCQGGTRAHTHTHTLSSLAHGAQLSLCWHESFPRLSGQKPPTRLGGSWGAGEQGRPLPLLPSPIVCDLPPVLMSYLGCIFFVIAKQWQEQG